MRQNGLNTLLALLILAGFSLCLSCASLSRGQVQALNKFSNACDSFKRYPSLLFKEVAEIRFERGLLYAASLSDPQNRISELNSIQRAFDNDMSLAKKCDASLDILKTYSNALKVLTANGRWEQRGREFRALGKTLDSLVLKVNKLELFREPLPVGIGKSAGVIVAYGAEQLVKSKQHRLTRKFVAEADTLIQTLVISLTEALRTPAITAIFQNEGAGLERSYHSFLMAANELAGKQTISLPQYDRQYLNLLQRSQKLTYERGYITAAAKRLATTHTQLKESMIKGKKADELYNELQQLIESIETLQKEFKVIVSAI